MIQGEMKCIGTSQHIKDKYGSGYQLEIKLKTAKIATEDLETSAIKDFVAFTNSIFSDDSEAPELKENFGNWIFCIVINCKFSLFGCHLIQSLLITKAIAFEIVHVMHNV